MRQGPPPLGMHQGTSLANTATSTFVLKPFQRVPAPAS
jgi:hypothetical protein